MEPTGKVSTEEAESLLKPVSIAEIKNSVLYANPHKAPSPDGFNAHLYKVCWPIIGADVCMAIQDFFCSGSLLS